MKMLPKTVAVLVKALGLVLIYASVSEVIRFARLGSMEGIRSVSDMYLFPALFFVLGIISLLPTGLLKKHGYLKLSYSTLGAMLVVKLCLNLFRNLAQESNASFIVLSVIAVAFIAGLVFMESFLLFGGFKEDRDRGATVLEAEK